jgi:GTP-binding protein
MKKTVVAILGRPNVGKSTLFNRIVRKREAIVDDAPGVTRDRKYASAEWAGVEFELVDTGGYVPNSKDVFESAIRQQVQYAIHDAILVIFVVDVLASVTPLDEEIASLLKHSGANVLLAVNKVDNEEREADSSEFYRLGLGEPFAVSAISGRGTGDFLDAVISRLPKYESGNAFLAKEEVHLAVLGKPNVGKSSYVNAILGQERLIITDVPGTTRDSIDSHFNYKGRDLVLVDTAGLRKRAKVKEDVEYFSNVRAYEALRRCDVAIILLDATEGITDQDKKIIANAVKEGRGIVLGVNKWDLIEKETNTARHFEIEIREQLRDMAFIPVMFISAMTKQRVFQLVDMACSVHAEGQRHLQTAELNNFLKAALQKSHPPAYGSKYVKINYVTQTKVSPPSFSFFTNEPKGIRQNYRNYLENQLRQRFGFMGVPIRLQFRKKN